MTARDNKWNSFSQFGRTKPCWRWGPIDRYRPADHPKGKSDHGNTSRRRRRDHRGEERYLGFIFDRTKEVDPSTGSGPLPGDVMVFRYGRCYAHGGIVTIAYPLTIVHAFQPARVVLEEEVARSPALCAVARHPKFFSPWAKES